jgi:hypothetical protein
MNSMGVYIRDVMKYRYHMIYTFLGFSSSRKYRSLQRLRNETVFKDDFALFPVVKGLSAGRLGTRSTAYRGSPA